MTFRVTVLVLQDFLLKVPDLGMVTSQYCRDECKGPSPIRLQLGNQKGMIIKSYQSVNPGRMQQFNRRRTQYPSG